MPRGYATAGPHIGKRLAAELGRHPSVYDDVPTNRQLSCTGNAATAAVVRCKCIEDDVNHVYYAD